MNKQNRNIKKNDLAVLGLAASALLILTACEKSEQSGVNLLPAEQEEQQTVNLFSPMEKTEPDTENAARNATDTTVAEVTSTSPKESAAAASITFDPIRFPSFLLKSASHSFTPMDKERIARERT